MTDNTQQDTIEIACDLTVFTDEERERHMQVVHDLFAKVMAAYEADDGYKLRLPDEVGIVMMMADFINDERRCCPFIHFGIEVEAGSKAIWLLLKGGADVKAAIKGEVLEMLPDNVMVKSE